MTPRGWSFDTGAHEQPSIAVRPTQAHVGQEVEEDGKEQHPSERGKHQCSNRRFQHPSHQV